MTVTFKLKYLWLVVGIAMLLLATSPIVYLYTNTGSGGGSVAPPPSAQVNCNNPCEIPIQNSQFGNGQPIIIKAGTVVTWVNKDDTTHTSTSNNGVWDTGIIAPGATSKPVTFSSPGTYPYFCQVHPMSGQIVVVS
ncbi:MAG: cupredoxin domain-containing protein [Thaumarchaeota archaeon]|nr:cupredoxin domain-containing protein [Nitrososphaerota archaeon]